MKDLRLVRVSNQAPVTLGKELGRGGEGAVYLVNGLPDMVAKVYLKPPTHAKADKLKSMARNAEPALLRVAAWPVDLLVDHSSLLRGFLMPRAGAREDLHELYNPKGRRRAFPKADFRFVVRVATNLARAFAQVHARGNVIGDVNHGNALVGADGTVLLIDCDSFQVRDSGRVFTCDVGVPLFTAPELAGQGFRGLKRTANHDAFGLAVAIFHLLYLGRHPFAGRYAEGEMPIERAIAEYRFAYGAYAALHGMTAPPGTLLLGVFGSEIGELFERAFARSGAGARPSAVEWVDALKKLEDQLVECPANAAHHHPRDQYCCWCAHEVQTGLRMFGRQLGDAVAASAVKVARIWDAITAVQRPEPLPPVEVPQTRNLSSAIDVLGHVPRAALAVILMTLGIGCALSATAKGAVFAVAYVGCAVSLYASRLFGLLGGEKARERKRTIQLARESLAALSETWNRLRQDARFEQLFQRLEETKQQLLEMPGKRQASIKALAENAANRQRDAYLSMFMIHNARLPLDAQDIALLASFGIDSADDVLRNMLDLPPQIPRKCREYLKAWAKTCERNFQFDPARGASPADIREIDELLASQQSQYLTQLEQGAKELRALSRKIADERREVQRRMYEVHTRLKAAERESG